MPPPSPLPRYVYKLLPEQPPFALPETLPLSALDSKDGFIHLSTAEQTPATAARFFSHADVLWILKIALSRIEENVRWEEAKSGYFAHLYGRDLGRDVIDVVEHVTKERDATWGTVLKEKDWLE